MAELEERIAQLTTAVATRDTFIACVANELRNSVTPIIGHLERLMAAVRAGRDSPAEVAQSLARIHKNVTRHSRRAALLLDVSRVTTGTVEIEPEAFDLSALLREVAGDFASAARQAGIPIALHVPDTLPGTWDHWLMEQIIDNLLSNALRYGGRTPVELSAGIHGDRMIRIQVRDHGGGITAAERERVFGQFDRAAALQGPHSGFGVGLWVVRQFVEAMRGAIAIDDAPDGGALLAVTLPQNISPEVAGAR